VGLVDWSIAWIRDLLDDLDEALAQLAAERERRQREGDEMDDLWQSKLHAALAERDAERKLREAEDALTHRPSSLDLDHTACGLPLERFPVDRNLQLGEGETCQRCTHVVAAVAKERERREAAERALVEVTEKTHALYDSAIAAQKQAEERAAGLEKLLDRAYDAINVDAETVLAADIRAALEAAKEPKR